LPSLYDSIPAQYKSKGSGREASHKKTGTNSSPNTIPSAADDDTITVDLTTTPTTKTTTKYGYGKAGQHAQELKRKAGHSDDISPRKIARANIVSSASKSLSSRFSPIDDGSEGEEDDIGKQIGDHMIPIGLYALDPKPKRLVFATIDMEGQLELAVYPIDRSFHQFTTTPQHEQNIKSYGTRVPMDPQQWVESHVDLNRKMSADEKSNIRSYVFRKIRESKARDRIDAWTDEADASINKRNQRNLNEARALIQTPRKDPFRTATNNVDLQHLIRQADALHNTQDGVTNITATAWNAVVDRASTLTDIKDIEQARKFTNVLLEYTHMQFWQKAWREVQFHEARVKPMEAANTNLETWLPDPIRKQLFSTDAEGPPTIRWQISEIRDGTEHTDTNQEATDDQVEEEVHEQADN
jgi:hypothetical protein